MEPVSEWMRQWLTGPYVHEKTDAELIDHAVLFELSWFLNELGLSRREIPVWIETTILKFEGSVCTSEGVPLDARLFDIAPYFPEEAAKESHKWMGSFLKFAAEPWKQKPQERVLPRLRIIDVAYQIAQVTGSAPARDHAAFEVGLLNHEIKLWQRIAAKRDARQG